MKSALKYILLIALSLIIGFVIGFLVSGRMTKARIERMNSFYTEQGFNKEFVRMLNLSPEQMEEVEPILRKHAEMNKEAFAKHRNEQTESFSQLEAELIPHLTDVQIEKLQRIKERWKRGPKMQKNRNNTGHGRRGEGRGEGRKEGRRN